MKVPGVDALREALAALNIDTRGHKDTLKKRLRAAQKKSEYENGSVNDSDRKPLQTRPAGQDFDSYLVVDFEATCERWEPSRGQFFGYPNEIIEFPVVLLQWRRKSRRRRSRSSSASSGSTSATSGTSSSSTSSERLPASNGYKQDDTSDWELQIVDEFRRFVRPTWRPMLSEFCTELTGITQADVDAADTFMGVLNDCNFTFLCKHDLFEDGHKWTWVTDGPWDLRDFISKQCYISNMKRPTWLGGQYIDLRASATAYFAHRSLPPSTEPVPGEPTPIPAPSTRALGTANIPTVLQALGLKPFEGRQHSGIDDVRNIARILQEIVRPERGWRVTANANVHAKERRWDWMKKGRVVWDHPQTA